MSKRARWAMTAVVSAALVAGGLQPARGQVDPRQVLAGMIRQVQTGTPNPSWYGLELWQTIAVQTGNTGVYPQLRMLGTVQNINVTQQQRLPQGWLYAMTAIHQNGQSRWTIGISSLTNRIEYANFAIDTMPGGPLPGPTPTPDPGQTPAPTPLPTPTPTPPGQGSEACKKFPNLC